MIDVEALADRLDEMAKLLRTRGGGAVQRTKGQLMVQRCEDWENAIDPRLHVPEPGDDETDVLRREGRSDIEEEDRKGDAAASRYKAELSKLTDGIGARLSRLTTIVNICNPERPGRITKGDQTAAQVAAEGWCVSCWRDDQTFEMLATGQYRDRCRFCGDWKGAHGEDPPVWLLRKRRIHGKRMVTTSDVAKALAK